MKAVVVIDEKPDDCRHCRFRGMSYTGTSYCIFMTGDIPDKSKPDWCPLHDLPEQADETPYDNSNEEDFIKHSYEAGFAKGWNICLRVITGEKEE